MSDLPKEVGGDKPSIITESITPLPSISEMDRELAQVALQEFEQRNFDFCLNHLRNLLSNRPQDAKVFHNVHVTEYCLSNLKDTGTFRKNLQDVSKQVHVMFDNVEILEVDHCVLFYNQAVLLYHLNQHNSAINILDKVFQFIEPLDEVFAKNVCFLLLELYLSTFQPKKAHALIGYMETMLFVNSKPNQNEKSNEKDINKDVTKDSKENANCGDVLKPRLQQYKARCFAMMKTAKACKREIKGLMSPSLSIVQNILAYYLKSQLEYQRGNYRKALKIISSPTMPENVNQFFHETGICLPAIFYNNVGCIHFCMGKFHLGSLYFGRALKEYESMLKNSSDGLVCEISSRPLHNLCLNMRYPLSYNLGVQHLHSGNYQKAFDCLAGVVKVYHRNPRLWLRLAECCIHICKSRDEENVCISQLKKNLVKDAIGFGMHRKLVLVSSPSKVYRIIDEVISNSIADLEFASMCLHNALNLLPEETVNVCADDMSPTRKTNEENDVGQTQENSYVPALPTCPVQGTELFNLRNSILVASSYVSLCLGDINLSYKYAEKLLSQPRLSGAHRFLGHLYAGESLILMDRITEAIEHLKPEHVIDVTLMYPLSCDEAKTTDKVEEANKLNLFMQSWYPHNLSTAKVISHFNLTAAYTLREEWDKANDCLRQVFAAKNQDTEIPSQAYMLAIYIKLQQGFADKAKGFIKQYLPQYR